MCTVQLGWVNAHCSDFGWLEWNPMLSSAVASFLLITTVKNGYLTWCIIFQSAQTMLAILLSSWFSVLLCCHMIRWLNNLSRYSVQLFLIKWSVSAEWPDSQPLKRNASCVCVLCCNIVSKACTSIQFLLDIEVLAYCLYLGACAVIKTNCGLHLLIHSTGPCTFLAHYYAWLEMKSFFNLSVILKATPNHLYR